MLSWDDTNTTCFLQLKIVVGIFLNGKTDSRILTKHNTKYRQTDQNILNVRVRVVYLRRYVHNVPNVVVGSIVNATIIQYKTQHHTATQQHSKASVKFKFVSDRAFWLTYNSTCVLHAFGKGSFIILTHFRL